MKSICAALALALTLSAANGARAEETYATDTPTCAGVYGALADMRGQLSQAFAVFGQTNFAEIDYPGRRDKLMAGADDMAKIGQMAAQTEFKNMLVKDVVNKTPEHVPTVLQVQRRCDAAYKLTPTFMRTAQ